MLVRLGNRLINTDHITDAEFEDRARAATLLLRGVGRSTQNAGRELRLEQDEARALWARLCGDAEDLQLEVPPAATE